MIPQGLKVGDTFNDEGMIYRVTKVVGVNYESQWVGATSPVASVKAEAEIKKEEPKEEKVVEADTPDYQSMQYAQLKKLCAERGLDAKGSKADLIARLEK